MRKFFATVLAVMSVLTAALVGAAVQMFDGEGKYIMSDFENPKIAEQRAIQRAKENAQDKAGVYLTSFSKSVNARITADEISAVTNNIIEVSDVDVQAEPFEVKGETGIIYTVTLKAKIDTDGIDAYLKRDDKDKVTIVQQNTDLRDAVAKNDKQVKDLKAQYKRAATQAERDRIRKQFNDADRDFLANQKFKEALKRAYIRDFDEAIKLYTEAIELKPNYAEAYNNRGNSYHHLKQYELAIQDYNKALKFKQHEFIYANRGMVYEKLKQYEKAIQDYDKAIKLNPNFTEMYNERGNTYVKLKLYKRAIQDYTKVISLNSNLSEGDLKLVYYNRGFCYQYIGDNEKAQADFAKAKELG